MAVMCTCIIYSDKPTNKHCLETVSHLDGEVIPHVIPEFEATQKRHPAASTCWGVIVKAPPDGIQHTDQPEASEQQVKEQEDAGGC